MRGEDDGSEGSHYRNQSDQWGRSVRLIPRSIHSTRAGFLQNVVTVPNSSFPKDAAIRDRTKYTKDGRGVKQRDTREDKMEGKGQHTEH